MLSIPKIKTLIHYLYIIFLLISIIIGLNNYIKNSRLPLFGPRSSSLNLYITELEQLKAQADCAKPVYLYVKQREVKIMFAVVYVDQLVGYSFAPCHVVLKFNEPVKPEEGYLLIHKSHESYNSFLDNLRIVSKTQNFVLMEVIQYLKQ